MKTRNVLIPIMLTLVTTPVFAASSVDAAIGGAVGGGVGAYLGNEIGGNTGAVIGGAVGAATGAAVATNGNDDRYARPVYGNPPLPYGYDTGYRSRPYYPEPSYRYRSPPGHFCPPGQAKKGRCY